MNKIISITSGKGGVGKTFISLLLARELSKNEKVVLVDADIENPNLSIYLKGKVVEKIPVFGIYPVINKSKCTKCGICAKVCKNNAIFFAKGNYPIVVYDLCDRCKACIYSCPFKAMDEKKEKVGEIMIKRISKNLTLFEGIAKKEEPYELTNKMLEKIKEVEGIVILDTSAGLHCNVIPFLINSEKAVVVKDESLFSERDAKRIISFLKKKGKKYFILKNKSLKEEKNTIPFSEEISKEYAEGKIPSVKIPEELIKWIKK